MEEWDRDTPWRQGHALSEALFSRLFPEELARGYKTAIVISHDCDLASDVQTEPCIELILAKFVKNLDGNLTYSKNSRRLQLTLERSESKLILELYATERVRLKKLDLLGEQPEDNLRLSLEATRTFQHWLSDRYARSSFSNNFNDALQSVTDKKWTKIIEPLGSILEAVYFDVDDNGDIARKGGEPPFELTIYLLYSLEQDAAGLTRTADATSKITELFSQKFYDAKLKRWKIIHLLNCFATSNEAMSVADHNRLRRWQGDYLSLRAKPQHPVAKL